MTSDRSSPRKTSVIENTGADGTFTRTQNQRAENAIAAPKSDGIDSFNVTAGTELARNYKVLYVKS